MFGIVTTRTGQRSTSRRAALTDNIVAVVEDVGLQEWQGPVELYEHFILLFQRVRGRLVPTRIFRRDIVKMEILV